MNKHVFKGAAMVATLASVVGLGLTSAVFANGPAHTNKVALHKLAYQNEATEVQNTGDVMEISAFGSSARAWNNKTDGTIQFTAYKLDDSQMNIDKQPQAVAQEVADAIAQKKDTLPYGAKQEGVAVSVGDDGLANFNLPDGTYVFVESTVSGIVTQPAKPILARLPMANADGRSTKDVVNLYPKNKIQEAEVTFTKFLQDAGKDPEVYKNENSGFSLYQGEPGKGTKVENSYQNLKNGTVTVKGLTVGKYYFVEENHTDPQNIDYKLGPDGIGYDTDVTNNEKNLLTFEYTAEGKIVFPETSLLKAGNKVINYTIPTNNPGGGEPGGGTEPGGKKPGGGVVKQADKTSVGFDEDITYTIKSMVPANIKKYASYSLTDKPDEMLKVNTKSFKLEADKMDDGSKIKDVTFTQEVKQDGSIKITPNLDELHALPNGSVLKLVYTAKLDPVKVEKLKPATGVKNSVTLDFNNNVITTHADGDETVKTFEAALKKVDNGIFNSGVVKQPLKGAKFVLAKATGDSSDTITTYLKRTYVDPNGSTPADPASGKPPVHQTPANAGTHYEWVTDKSQATEFETGDDGTLAVNGLGNGDYFFVETQAPDGYNLNSDVYTHFAIKDASVDGDKTLEITNSRKPNMPMTGTEVTALVVAGLTAGTTIVTVMKRRKKKNN